VECDPHNPEAHAELARLCLEWRRHDEAISVLRRAVALSPRDAYLRLMLVHAYRRKGNLQQALKEITALEKLAPDSMAVRQGRAAIERQMKRARRASSKE
jgi:Flp pilus assembly protein TadD